MPIIVGDASSTSGDVNLSHWKGFVSVSSKTANCDRSISLPELHGRPSVRQCMESFSANDKKSLVGHVPVELTRLMKNFLEEFENILVAKVTRKRKRESGFVVVPLKFSAFMTMYTLPRFSTKS